MTENQLKLPLFPEWDNENKWKLGQVNTVEIPHLENGNMTTFTANCLPNTLTFTVLGKDMVIIDEDGVKWNKNGRMYPVENSEELKEAFMKFFNMIHNVQE